MNDDPDHTRRWLISASGAVLSGALATRSSYAQVASPSAIKSQDLDQPPGETISPATTALCDYVAKALGREMPPEVVAKTKLHTLDTIAAMVSGHSSIPVS